MLQTLTGNDIDYTPPVGHSISTASTPTTAQKGSTSSGGPSSAYLKFATRRRLQDNLLAKATQREQLVDRIQKRLDMFDSYLSDDEVFFQKLEEAKLRDLILGEGVYIDKLQALTGHATQIVSVQHHEKIDQLLPALTAIMQQRGLKVTATQQKLEMTTEEPCAS